MFENKNKICVWGCGASRQSEIFPFVKIKPLLYYFKRLTGGHLEIIIIFYYHSKCLKTNIEFVFGGVVHYYCVYYHIQCLRPKIKFVIGQVVLTDNLKYFHF